MSTLITANISDGTDTVATTYVTKGTAKAFAAYEQQGTNSITESNNVTSITDEGVGDAKLTFTSTFLAATYAPVASGKRGGNNLAAVVGPRIALLATAISLVHDNGAGSPQDCEYCGCHVLGELA